LIAAKIRRRIVVRGTVQGVGFRPFVYRQAIELSITGFVRNDSSGVVIEAEGTSSAVEELCQRVAAEPPPLAIVSGVDVAAIDPIGDDAFEIIATAPGGAPRVPVSVDTPPCASCLEEMDDPANRRYRYPFINCTDCGPRYTIVVAVPYDRPSTTMARFVMCSQCAAEYHDPGDRRFHAQPNACPECGPALTWADPDGARRDEGSAALDAAVRALREGRILGVKGVGGYHLATDATDEHSVAELRRRKARDDKPFAVMVADLSAASALCELNVAAMASLISIRRPIVIAPRRGPTSLATGVAPGLDEVGVFLPYSPIHHLLARGVGRPLVMTSGNLSDEPIAHDDEDAITRLGALVDGFLLHNRPIHIRCDDSVGRARRDGIQLLRRSRGYAPEPLPLPLDASRPILAVGAELKSTVAVATRSHVVPSHHIGDLEHLATYRSFIQAVDHLCRLYGVEPEVVAHDLHPEYLSTKFAVDLDLDAVAVQHHHAHVASCLVEHQRTDPVIGVAFDGLGYGPDGTMWGGEFLLADLHGFERLGHLAPVVMPGGTAAIREPWRMAVSWGLQSDVAPVFDDGRLAAVISLVEAGRGPMTTSVGRLFDALAALIGLRSTVSHEAQAAVALEAAARHVPRDRAPVYPVRVAGDASVRVLDPRQLIAAAVSDRRAGAAIDIVAAGIHEGIGRATADLAWTLATERGMDTVALSGGVFQNARLSEIVTSRLQALGLTVLAHARIPPNDGGISLGQAAIAAARG